MVVTAENIYMVGSYGLYSNIIVLCLGIEGNVDWARQFSTSLGSSSVSDEGKALALTTKSNTAFIYVSGSISKYPSPALGGTKDIMLAKLIASSG